MTLAPAAAIDAAGTADGVTQANRVLAVQHGLEPRIRDAQVLQMEGVGAQVQASDFHWDA
jgi:hypothetical protein